EANDGRARVCGIRPAVAPRSSSRSDGLHSPVMDGLCGDLSQRIAICDARDMRPSGRTTLGDRLHAIGLGLPSRSTMLTVRSMAAFALSLLAAAACGMPAAA